MSPKHRLAAAIAAAALALAAPAVAGAQSSPFQGLPPASQPQQTQTVSTTRTNVVDNGGLERWQEILIFLGGVALLGGIAFAILGDARRNAPDAAHELAAAAAGQGTHKHADKARARKRAKQQRAARRKNRRHS
jgi:hypothetical protein